MIDNQREKISKKIKDFFSEGGKIDFNVLIY